jgi:hypothetical protein
VAMMTLTQMLAPVLRSAVAWTEKRASGLPVGTVKIFGF